MPYLSYDTGLELFEPTIKLVAQQQKHQQDGDIDMSRDEVITGGVEKESLKQTSKLESKREAMGDGTVDGANITTKMDDMAVQATPKHKDFAPSTAKAPQRAPPSPPLSKVRIAPCPPRLAPIVPPTNWGAVRDHQIFRSGFPTDENLIFLATIPLKSCLTLVDTAPTSAYETWIRSKSIKRSVIPIAANKEGRISITHDSMCAALLFLMDSSNWPLYIHCNQGKHRTGCVIACLQKVWRQPLEDVLWEYGTYARSKQRDADIEFITNFNPDSVFAYAKANGFLEQPRMKRMDSMVADIDSLAEALASGAVDDEGDYAVSDGTDSSSSMGSSADSEVWGESTRPLVMRSRSKSDITRSKVAEIMGTPSSVPTPAVGVEMSVDEMVEGAE